MASSLSSLLSRSKKIKPKVINPSVTSSCIDPDIKYHYEEAFNHGLNFSSRFPASLRSSMGSLKQELEQTWREETVHEYDFLLKMHGHRIPQELVLLGGDGLISICMKSEHDNQGCHELVIRDNSNQQLTPLGTLPSNGYYGNFGITGRFGCCMREPGFFCQLTQDGNYVVLFGPKAFARGYTEENDTPVLLVYKIDGAQLLFEKSYPKQSFVKCSPVGISISPASIPQGQYKIALVTKEMEVRFWNPTSEEGTILQLESLKCCSFVEEQFRNPLENCIKFSPDGRCLSVMGFLEDYTGVCVLINTNNLEAMCWVPFMENITWLRWLFPMFSTCGTTLAMATFHDRGHTMDILKYDVFFYSIPLMDHSLKNLCRIVILKHVRTDRLDELPLPNDLITFLSVGSVVRQQSQLSVTSKQKCKCSLM